MSRLRNDSWLIRSSQTPTRPRFAARWSSACCSHRKWPSPLWDHLIIYPWNPGVLGPGCKPWLIPQQVPWKMLGQRDAKRIFRGRMIDSRFRSAGRALQERTYDDFSQPFWNENEDNKSKKNKAKALCANFMQQSHPELEQWCPDDFPEGFSVF